MITKSVRGAAAVGRRLVDTVRSSRSDVVYLYREALPLGPAILEPMLAGRVPLVYDFDDAIWIPTSSPTNPFGARLRSAGKVDAVIRSAAITTVGNEYLAQHARLHSSRVRVLPTTLDINRYEPRPRLHTRGPIRLGWSGSHSTVPHLRTIESALVTVLARPDIELFVQGGEGFSLPAPAAVTAVRWAPATELDQLHTFAIGLMPLPDDEWTRGKCGFKALLYMSLGIPVVASPVGVNNEIIEHGVNGLLASTTQEWVEAVATLADDESLRTRLGTAGRETVIERFSGQRWAPTFLATLQEAASQAR